MAKTFNGTSSIITLSPHTALDAMSAKTVAAWCYINGWGENNLGRIFEKLNGAADGWVFTLHNSPTAATFSLIHSVTSVLSESRAAASSLSTGKWWFLAGTHPGGNAVSKLYIGDLSTPPAEPGSYVVQGTVTPASETAAAFIGNRAVDTNRTYDGNLAHVSVWDTDLDANQLNLLRIMPYAAFHRFTKAGTLITLKGYWPLGESAAGTSLDHSGQGSTGTDTSVGVPAAAPWDAPFEFTRRGVRRVWRSIPAAGNKAGPLVGSRILNKALVGGGLIAS